MSTEILIIVIVIVFVIPLTLLFVPLLPSSLFAANVGQSVLNRVLRLALVFLTIFPVLLIIAIFVYAFFNYN